MTRAAATWTDVAVERLMAQRCKVCWSADGFSFHVRDDVWASVVPPALRCRVVCLACFDRMAVEAGVDYADAVDVLVFSGRAARLELVAGILVVLEEPGGQR